MNTAVLIFNIGIPVMMIFIGALYKFGLHKKVDKILDCIMPVAMASQGFSDHKELYSYKNKIALDFQQRRCSLIWCISGAALLLFVSGCLVLNKSYAGDISISLLEVEGLVLLAVFATVNFILKIKVYKKN